MNFDLARMIKQTRNPRRKQIEVRPIDPPAAMAADLYAQCFKPVVSAWQRAIERIGAEYARSVPIKDASISGTTGAVGKIDVADSIFDLDSVLASIGDELQRIVIAITPSLRDWSIRAEGWHRGRWRGAVLTATGIDLQTILSPHDEADTVQAFVARNVGLVRSVSDETRQKVGDIVFRGYQARTPAREVARDMADAVELGRKRALRIASDQNKKLAARLDQARQEQAGIATYTWRHSLKRHPRQIHVERNGKVFQWDKPPADGPPGTLPYCGCRAQARISLE
jgi:SPP1 gp7 family putative phage head morphogenesis protein